MEGQQDAWHPIASFIRRERVRQGMNVAGLARAVGVSRVSIHNWEAGKSFRSDWCAPLAAALDVDVNELLALHPYAVSDLDLGPDARENPSDWTGDGVDSEGLGPDRRLIYSVATALLVAVGLTMYATWQTAQQPCFEAGVGGGSLQRPFRAAFDHHGGEPLLGCAVGEVYKWGPAYVQEFSGGIGEQSGLFTLDEDSVFVLTGEAMIDFARIAGGGTTEVVGAPVADPLRCGRGVVVEVSGGLDGPGALVSNDDWTLFAWFPQRFWLEYTAAGGPTGNAGLPVSILRRTAESITIEIESGEVSAAPGASPSIDAAGPPFEISSCEPITWETVLLGPSS